MDTAALKEAFACVGTELDKLAAMLHLDRETPSEEPMDTGDSEEGDEEYTDPSEEMEEEGSDMDKLSGIFGGVQKKKKPMMAVSIGVKSPSKPKAFG